MTPDRLASLFRHLQGRVNLLPVKGKAAGTLLFLNWQVERAFDVTGATITDYGNVQIVSCVARVNLSHDAGGWSNVPGPDGKRYALVHRDSKRPIYEADVFPAEDGFEYVVTDCAPRRTFQFVVAREPVADEPVTVGAST